ncbi:anaerobic ribonucleoside triphosphate reductase [Spiroplasma turonicum]|uniref:Anaerobic ribonucleoside-triphosphate reductase n=1 Tax=Spiroplasma turonicum TaxID=216946 RepID=A0A0K1P5X9_9MOLU|nr:anaerobic ribonucleoside triphosphate reductase [Spiroplasma turonicum]AKU79327.1 anaerobic ribonucleoside-triphosphate reductase [Spiroplasma turonicum]ALX70348.1 anaerobic ribonucleoside-triphosphate reductase [Spiroplasma turonicum]
MTNTKNLSNEISSIISVENNDLKNENANMSGDTPSGKMMKFASITSKEYALDNLLEKKIADLHRKSLIHIHDLDYYATKSATCVQYNLDEIFKNGFYTRNGYIREPKSIAVYAELAAIVFQTAQNEMHGGQAIPAFDFFMAKGVAKSFIKRLFENIISYLEILDVNFESEVLRNIIESADYIGLNNTNVDKLYEELKSFEIPKKVVQKLVNNANKKVISDTDQAMEGFIYNLNTQHSRGGNQVVFSSINLGTDTSNEGRQVIKSLFKALRNGLGNGETSIFPIVIFKVKEGINFSDLDKKRADNLNQNDWDSINDWNTRNFDLFLDALKTTSTRLFPNFMFLDQPYNKHEKWDINDENRWMFEPATMGCRTRVFENINGEKTSVGRGNLSFTSINLPYLALELLEEKGLLINSYIDRERTNRDEIKFLFLNKVNKISNDICQQLYNRYKFQISAIAKEFPFLMKNNVLTGGELLKVNDSVEEVFLKGTLTIGFVGLAESLKALIGLHHGESDEAQDLGLEVVKEMNKVAQEWKEKTHLNYGVIATPAESVAGRMAKITKSRFGTINEVTSRDYFTNSNHVPVYYNLTAYKKIIIEAAYHELTLGGNISYIELDGEAKKNLHAILSVVDFMKKSGINYGSLNHPVDRCKKCHYTSLIQLNCPKCGANDISRTRRITGYLVGDLDGWNSGKQAEESERVKHLKQYNENS